MNKPASRQTVKSSELRLPTAIFGAIPVSKVVIVALLLLAVFFYIRAISTSVEQAPQIAGAEVEYTQENEVVAQRAMLGGNAVGSQTQETSHSPTSGAPNTGGSPQQPRDASTSTDGALNPQLVSALSTVIDPSDDTKTSTTQMTAGLLAVPDSQIDMIKRVFAPELLGN